MQPFGWPAREFLRQNAIGRQVKFRVDYKVEKIQRTFATLWFTDHPTQSINKLVAEHGWARVTAPEKSGGSDVSVAFHDDMNIRHVAMLPICRSMTSWCC